MTARGQITKEKRGGIAARKKEDGGGKKAQMKLN